MSARDLPTPVSLGVRRSLLPVFKAAAVSRPETGNGVELAGALIALGLISDVL